MTRPLRSIGRSGLHVAFTGMAKKSGFGVSENRWLVAEAGSKLFVKLKPMGTPDRSALGLIAKRCRFDSAQADARNKQRSKPWRGRLRMSPGDRDAASHAAVVIGSVRQSILTKRSRALPPLRDAALLPDRAPGHRRGVSSAWVQARRVERGGILNAVASTA